MAQPPTIPTERIAACNNCGAAEAETVAKGIDFEYDTCANEFRYVRCTACGLVYLQNRPAPETLDTIYPPAYRPHQFRKVLGGTVSWLRDRVQAKKVRVVERYAPPGALVADVGCGSGELLRLLREQGREDLALVGVDFSESALARVRALGIETLHGRFEAMDWPLRAPDVIVMNQVIEHLDDPAAVVRKAFEILAPGGALVVETPSLEGLDAWLFRRRYWGGYHIPRHWTLYSGATLGALLRQAGFDVTEVRYLLSPTFWLQSLHHVVLERTGRKRVARLFDTRIIVSLVAATGLEFLLRPLRGTTSNMRMVGRKPGARET